MTDSATEFELFQADTDLLESPALAARNASKPRSPLEDIRAPKTSEELFNELEFEPSQVVEEIPQVQPIKQASPDKAARVLKLSKNYNRPIQLVEENLPFFEQKEKNEQAQQAIQQAPILRTRYQDSLFRALAVDDTEALTWWETGWKDITEGFQAGLDSRELGLLGHKSLIDRKSVV